MEARQAGARELLPLELGFRLRGPVVIFARHLTGQESLQTVPFDLLFKYGPMYKAARYILQRRGMPLE
jgi:hypothetical protein